MEFSLPQPRSKPKLQEPTNGLSESRDQEYIQAVFQPPPIRTMPKLETLMQVIQLVVMIFLLGGAWANINGSINTLKDKLQDTSTAVAELRKTVQDQNDKVQTTLNDVKLKQAETTGGIETLKATTAQISARQDRLDAANTKPYK
jgi:hypothetical protein